MFKFLLKRWPWILAGLVLVLGLGMVTGWMLFQHIPGWYQPPQVAAADLQRIRDDLTRTYDALGVALNQARGTFDFRLTQGQVNAWLAAREGIDPQTRDWLPPGFSDPMVVFENGRVCVAATYSQDDLHTVVSARVSLDADQEGVKVRLEGVSGGSLPLPEVVLRQALEAMDGHLSMQLAQAGVKTPGRNRPRVSDLLDGVILPNIGKWPGSGHRFRLVGVRCEPGALVLSLERLPRQVSTR